MLCTQLRSQCAEAAGIGLHTVTKGLQSGAADLLDAYRSIPVAAEDLPVNVIAAKCPHDGKAYYQRMFAMTFGLTTAVFGFTRWSAFLEGACRRIGSLMWSMHLDDGCLADFEDTETTGQELVGHLFSLLGTPSAPAKQQPMHARNTCLGLVHNLAQAVGPKRVH